MPERAAVQIGFMQPLGATAVISDKHAGGNPVDMETRARRGVEQFESHSQPLGVEQTGGHLSHQQDIRNEVLFAVKRWQELQQPRLQGS